MPNNEIPRHTTFHREIFIPPNERAPVALKARRCLFSEKCTGAASVAALVASAGSVAASVALVASVAASVALLALRKWECPGYGPDTAKKYAVSCSLHKGKKRTIYQGKARPAVGRPASFFCELHR